MDRLRSILFTPVINDRFVRRAPKLGADAICLDLEDSIPPSKKAEAREALAQASAYLRQYDVRIFVRVNKAVPQDLLACREIMPDGIIVPKVETEADLSQMRDAFAGAISSPSVVAIIETARGVTNAPQICGSPLVSALMFGALDLAFDCGMRPLGEYLRVPAMNALIAAKAAKKDIYGLVEPITNYRDLEGFHASAVDARDRGFTGTPVIHPDQVPIANGVFSADQDALDRARAIVGLYEASGGQPVPFESGFIEWPHYQAAMKLLRESEPNGPVTISTGDPC